MSKGVIEMLYRYENTIRAECLHRPSKVCKSPYVADIQLNDVEYLAHSPALGMDGYIAPGKDVLVCPINNPKGSCTYSIVAAYDTNTNILVGANPIHANKAFHEACKQQLLVHDFGEITSITPEYKHGNSRFDFYLNESIFVEVKSVIIAKDSVAYFPVGNKKKGTISERANKHVSELTSLANLGHKCAVVFMVLREDVTAFTPNTKDVLFCEYITKARESGVNIFAYQCSINNEGIHYKQKLEVI